MINFENIGVKPLHPDIEAELFWHGIASLKDISFTAQAIVTEFKDSNEYHAYCEGGI